MGDSDDESVKEEVKIKRALPTLKLPSFSGSGEGQGSSFEQWEYEVRALIDEKWGEALIRPAIRQSLKGKANEVLRSLGKNPDIEAIIKKLNVVFGSVETISSILNTLYSAKQSKAETASDFALRLETLFMKAVRLGRVEHSSREVMLKEIFIGGLKDCVRVAVSYITDDETLGFDDLVLKIKQKEATLSLGSNSNSSKSQIAELTATVASLKTELSELKLKQQTEAQVASIQNDAAPFAPPSHRAAQPRQGSQPFRGNRSGFRGSQPPFRGAPSHRGAGGDPHRDPSGGLNVAAQPFTPYGAEGVEPGDEVICYRCNEPGHVASGCRRRQRQGGSYTRGRPQARPPFRRYIYRDGAYANVAAASIDDMPPLSEYKGHLNT